MSTDNAEPEKSMENCGSNEPAEELSSTSLMVQFFGVHEATDSFDNSNLLASEFFKDMLTKIGSEGPITCYFVFQDLKAFVGFGTIERKENVNPLSLYMI